MPIDLGGSVVTSIAKPAYAALRDHMGLSRIAVREMETVQQIAFVDDDMLERLGVDVLLVFPTPPSGRPMAIRVRPVSCPASGQTRVRVAHGAKITVR